MLAKRPNETYTPIRGLLGGFLIWPELVYSSCMAPTYLVLAAQAATATDAVDWFTLIVGLIGGLALFLIGMDRMTEALRRVVGDKAKRILERLTSHRLIGLATGAGITAVIQSSSVTTVLVVGFITAGLMNLAQAIPVILGSNIGTTITAQIIAFNITKWALVLVAIGFVTSAVANRVTRKAQGTAIMGLGLVFYGMVVMGESMQPLRNYEPFIDMMRTLDNPFLGILAGAVITALVQSSSATTGIVIVLATQGLISPQAGIALVLGANIGTSVTALLAGIGKPRAAQRAAIAHLLFNAVGVLIWLPLIGLLTLWVESMGGGTAREIANAHTIFNVGNALLFLPFVKGFASLVERLVPDREQEGAMRPKYLDKTLVREPSLALPRARMEILRMARRVSEMISIGIPAALDGSIDQLADIEAMDDEVDDLHGILLEYLGRIGQEQLSPASSAELIDLFEATNALETIGDIIETNVISLGYGRIESAIEVSEATRGLISAYHAAVSEAFDLTLMAVTQKDASAAKKVIRMKGRIKALERTALENEAHRLVVNAPNRVATYRFEMDLIANLKRIYYFTRKIAKSSIPNAQVTDSLDS
jgi:phosphate:Na+ symporter